MSSFDEDSTPTREFKCVLCFMCVHGWWYGSLEAEMVLVLVI